ncbi:hypothetical protein [Phycisphaera mikurensis]|uniref:Uncharacterized protein n=1 Tax=Phycisphaera mikurensis (strain NBRC 102666 / KCTC 22515 / FYK2301M01) TaxID=1142394 RepID=I0IJE0_PHYMF|nr:hypothetical protein [Phycisphaera mikurensis]MBB6443206.1 hypothetical protein [Phycisphaera mikurensis]BAM05378.1 hypothetical protein PSMK_p00160 [Phycisphaera mikurensis NBRC 102666]
MAKHHSNTTRPAHTVRVGTIKAAIWANETQSGVRHQATFSRGYQVDGEWKDSTSFGLQDLPILEKVASLAFDWIHEAQEEAGGGD